MARLCPCMARLRPYVVKLVSLNQVSFVPRRQIVDNIVVSQEMLHKFKTSKGKKDFIAWKIDLSKAYGRLSWSFIEEVLWEIGIRGRILELQMHCISSVSYKVILNGEVIAGFSPQCGICQGDPLSLIISLFYAWRSFPISFSKALEIRFGSQFRFVRYVQLYPIFSLRMI